MNPGAPPPSASTLPPGAPSPTYQGNETCAKHIFFVSLGGDYLVYCFIWLVDAGVLKGIGKGSLRNKLPHFQCMSRGR